VSGVHPYNGPYTTHSGADHELLLFASYLLIVRV
jgi:hypothetical protein